MKVRIKFKKYGAVRYIGHLDVMRFFQKAMRRAQIDIAYTGGYSPHQIMSFAAPLGVGLESNGEYMDVELVSLTSCEDLVQRLNQVSAEGIEIVSATVLPEKAGNAMASVAAASYTLAFRPGREPKVNLRELLPKFYAQEIIPFEKETKKSKLVIDLKPGIYELTAEENGAVHMLLNASSSGNIKPAMVLDAFLAFAGETLPENPYFITREDTYLNAGTEENPDFKPLNQVDHLIDQDQEIK